MPWAMAQRISLCQTVGASSKSRSFRLITAGADNAARYRSPWRIGGRHSSPAARVEAGGGNDGPAKMTAIIRRDRRLGAREDPGYNQGDCNPIRDRESPS